MDPYGLPADLLARATGVSLDTARRWKRLGRIPPMPARLAAFVIAADLGALDRTWRGFVLAGGKLWTPYGFGVRPGQLCAIPWRDALIAELQRELRNPIQRDLFAETSQPIEGERSARSRARWWRGAKPWQQR